MNRRSFFQRLIGAALVAPLVPSVAATSPAAPVFPPLNYIDLPEPITGLVPLTGRMYALTERGIYEICGTGGRYISEGPRFRAEYLDNDHACVTLRQRL